MKLKNRDANIKLNLLDDVLLRFEFVTFITW